MLSSMRLCILKADCAEMWWCEASRILLYRGHRDLLGCALLVRRYVNRCQSQMSSHGDIYRR